jgi:hypothetical protein
MSAPLTSTLIALGASATAVWMVFSAFADAERMLASARWPSVDGVITASKVETFASDSGARRYIPTVAYTYAFDGRVLEGREIRIGGFITTEDVAEKVTGEYRAGANVKVYVDPADPSRAVLQPGLPGSFINRPYLAISAGLTFWMAEFFALVSITGRDIGARTVFVVLGGLILAALWSLAGGIRLIARYRRSRARGLAISCGAALIAIGGAALIVPSIVAAYKLIAR